MSPCIHVLDPLADPRWDDLVARDPRATVFHSRGWLEALRRTYGYEPFALTTTATGPIANGLVCCRVRTWAARRLVSLPFSDHCEPLVDTPTDLAAMVAWLDGDVREHRWRSFELRPRTELPLTAGGQPFPGLSNVEGKADDGPVPVRGVGQPFRADHDRRYVLHTLDLRHPAEQVFKGFHPSSTQRAIRRAEREGVAYEAGRSEAMLAEFYRLLRLTRRRHGLPPQPWSWFRNLVDCLGNGLTLYVARKDGSAIAAILTLSFKTSVVYKYGGSDAEHHALGAMPFLFWQVIRDAIQRGIEVLDLGRSDADQPGLIAFKDHLGAAPSTLTYYRAPARPRPAASAAGMSRLAKALAARLPDGVLDLSGRLLYRHLG